MKSGGFEPDSGVLRARPDLHFGVKTPEASETLDRMKNAIRSDTFALKPYGAMMASDVFAVCTWNATCRTASCGSAYGSGTAASITTTERYDRQRLDTLKEAVQQLERGQSFKNPSRLWERALPLDLVSPIQ